jgi:glycosyltransferase involved in cell wall biosynthesis
MLGWEYPPHIAGGLGTACLALTRALAEQGEDVLFVVPHRHGDEEAEHLELRGTNDEAPEAQGPPAGRITRRRVEFALSPYARPLAASTSGAPPGPAPYGPDLFARVERYAASVQRIARATAFDVVHAHDWMTFSAGVEAAREAQVPLVVHVHSLEQDRCPRGMDPRVLAAERAGLRAADLVLCVSALTARRAQAAHDLDPSRLRVVHNALPELPRRPARRLRRLRAGPVVLFLGRVTAPKGPEILLEAARRVVAVDPRVTFVIAGDGDLLASMIERAAAVGLARHVAFTGFLKGRAVDRAYAEADVFVLPSVSEPFGLTALEAAARGVPVILSRACGVGEVLKSALVVDAWDVEALADRILAVLHRPALAALLSRDGQREAKALSWAQAAERVRAAYVEASA